MNDTAATTKTKKLNARQMDMAFLFWMAFEIFSETGNTDAFTNAYRIFGQNYGGSVVTTRASLVGAGVLEMQPGGVWYVNPSKIAA